MYTAPDKLARRRELKPTGWLRTEDIAAGYQPTI
jgi:hypothetical protein